MSVVPLYFMIPEEIRSVCLLSDNHPGGGRLATDHVSRWARTGGVNTFGLTRKES
jgi:hypothetical protein